MNKLVRRKRSVKRTAHNRESNVAVAAIEQPPQPLSTGIEPPSPQRNDAQALYERRVALLEDSARGAFALAAEWARRRTKAREKEGALSIEAEAFYQAQISHYRSIAEGYRARLEALVAPSFVQGGAQ